MMIRMVDIILIIVWVACALMITVAITHAHDMDQPDAAWFKSLKVPGTERDCCSGPDMGPNVDCRNVDVRQARDPDGSIHWEAFASSELFPESATSPYYGYAPNDWVRVPPEAIVSGRNNPTGGFVGCWFDKKWRCFIEGSGT